MPIPPFGWKDHGPPDIDAANLESMLAAAGAYTDALAGLKALGEVEGNVTPNLAEGRVFTVTATGNVTIKKPTGWPAGVTYVELLVTEKEPGGHRITLEGMEWVGNTPVFNTTANAVTTIQLVSYNGGATVQAVGTEASPVVLDACRMFSAEPGKDATVPLQAAINAVFALGGGVVEFSCAGTYPINGAVIEAATEGYAHAGQLLFPANAISNGRVSIEIRGPVAAPRTWSLGEPSEPVTTTGVTLVSNATSGAMFDTIAGFKTALGHPFSNLFIKFTNMILRVPENPSVTGIAADALVNFKTEGVLVGPNTAGNLTKYPTGTGWGIRMPGEGNGVISVLRDTYVFGFANGVREVEHSLFSNLTIQFCKIGLSKNGSVKHETVCEKVLIQKCQVILEAPAETGGVILGQIDAEIGTGELETQFVVKDPSSLLRGELSIYVQNVEPTGGWPVSGSATEQLQINLRNPARGNVGFFNAYPRDEFTRCIDRAGVIGTSDLTSHPWRTIFGKWTTSTSAKTVHSEAEELNLAVLGYFLKNTSGTRTVKCTIKTAATAYNAGLVLGLSAVNGNYLFVNLQEEKVFVKKEVAKVVSTLAESGKIIAGNTEYKIVVTINWPANPEAKPVVIVYVNGVKAVEYVLTATDMENIAGFPNGPGRVQDGIRASKENSTTTFSAFQVIPSI